MIVQDCVNPITERASKVKPTDYSKDGWAIVECIETGMVFLANPPNYSTLQTDFPWEQTSELEAQRRKIERPMRSKVSQLAKRVRLKVGRSQKVAIESVQLLAGMPKVEQFVVVDVGCGDAQNGLNVARLAQTKDLVVKPVGLEISVQLAKESRARLKPFAGEVICAPAIEGLASMADESVDLLTLISFLEHEVQPAPLLRMCREKLKPTGRILLKVPNFDSINRKVFGPSWCGFRYPDHVNYFSAATLKILVERCGLEIKRSTLLDRFTTNDNMWAVIGPA